MASARTEHMIFTAFIFFIKGLRLQLTSGRSIASANEICRWVMMVVKLDWVCERKTVQQGKCRDGLKEEGQ